MSHTNSTTIGIGGMSCAACVGRVERALARVPGVTEAVVNLATRRAIIRHSPGLDAMALREAVTAAGFEAAAPEQPTPDEEPALRRAVILAAIVAVPLVALEMGAHILHGDAARWTQAALATTLVFGLGWRFHRAGWLALRHGGPDMNSLVALGTTAAWAFSMLVLLAPASVPEASRHLYFEAAGIIVALVLVGRWLEARARGRASQAIRRLMELAPAVARVERDGIEVEVPAAALRVGDVLVVRPGTRIPTDAIVLDGASHVDEAMITGEATPVAKAADDVVTGGTVNGAGALRLRATAVGDATVLSRIGRMVADAQGAKLPIQATVDRVTGWFVPAVMGVAALTFLGWLLAGGGVAMALTAAVAVLIIACPCAMGLATPVSIMVGTGRAAELGVLFRRGAALEALRGVSVIAMDKTGTLTEGRPALTDIEVAQGFDEAAILRLAAAVEARSEHPVAYAVREAAQARGITVPPAEGFEVVAGGGVRARVEGRVVAIGTEDFLGLGASPFAAGALAAAARTPLHMAVDGQPAALLGVADPVRASTPEALAALREMGLGLAMLTGDHAGTARAVAGPLGIAQVHAGLRPEGKLAALAQLRAGGQRIAFVGDGINDAPALATADVGIAIGGGTDIAIESADVVLMRGDLRGVVTAIVLSRATIANIRQNLAWAFGYNALLIPVAALGLLSPMLAAAAMALSSVCVVGNALRLRRAGRPY